MEDFKKRKRKAKKAYDNTVEAFHYARKKEQEARSRVRGSREPCYRRAVYVDHQRQAVLKVKTAAQRLRDAREIYNHILAEFAGIPEEYYNNSKFVETEEGEIHIYLGVFDPIIGQENHGHWIVNKEGKLRYARLPFEDHGPDNYEKDVDPKEFWKKYAELTTEEEKALEELLTNDDLTSLEIEDPL